MASQPAGNKAGVCQRTHGQTAYTPGCLCRLCAGRESQLVAAHAVGTADSESLCSKSFIRCKKGFQLLECVPPETDKNDRRTVKAGILQLRNLSTIAGVGCLVLAISGWLLRVFAFMHAQMSALADTVPRMPQACEEMGEVSAGPFHGKLSSMS